MLPLYKVLRDEFLIGFRSRKGSGFDLYIEFSPAGECSGLTLLVFLSGRSRGGDVTPVISHLWGPVKASSPWTAFVPSLNVLL